MASYSRSTVSGKVYDVFISHRGPDVKNTFAKQLYDHLEGRRLRTFLDRYEIEGGDCITDAIHNAICSSHVQIAIFSKGFSESPWCLNEVVLMLHQTNAVFIPVFYGVEPWELRHVDQHINDPSKKKSQYAKAFADYQSNRRYLDKLDVWKKALASAADICGYELSPHQEDLCEKIVSRVVEVVQEKENSIQLHVAKYPVGLDELVQDFDRCCSKKAGIVGIFGLGGSGKTTLAKELFNKRSSGYHKSSFLSDVRESNDRGELHILQSQLLKDLKDKDKDKDEDLKDEDEDEDEDEDKEKDLKDKAKDKDEDLKDEDEDEDKEKDLKDKAKDKDEDEDKDKEIRSVDEGIVKLKNRLGRTTDLRILIVVDDIDHQDQLDALLPEGTGMLGSDTLVIITTRDQRLLRGVDARYKMKEMDCRRAKELFCSHAFRRRDPPNSYQKLVESFVKFCAGLPLSLIVLGAHVYERDEYYWNLELEKVNKICPDDIMKRLKISFDGLDKEEKQIFIDIACIFNKKEEQDMKKKAIRIWKACGWSAEHALLTLQDKCLVEMGEDLFEMHDHLRDLGREMADELGPPRLWQPQLLRSMEEKGFKQTLAEVKGTCFHSFKDSSLGREITYFIANTDLVFLEIEDDFKSLCSIPSWIPLRKLRHLSISGVEDLWSSFEEQLESRAQATFELRTLYIRSSPSLQKIPNLIEMFSHLEELHIRRSLEKTDTTSFVQSLKQLSNLRILHLVDTKDGLFKGNLDLSSRMDSLETIKLGSLQNIFQLAISEEMCPKLHKLEIDSMENLKQIKLKSYFKVVDRSRLEHILITGCPKLQSVKWVED